MTPPIEMILRRGYAVAMVYPGEFTPDENERGLATLAAFPGRDGLDGDWGAVGAWAWGLSRIVDVLEQDERIDSDRITVFGHSRHGKSALLAAAFDPRIDAVIAHQSGTGGATLSRSDNGESVKQITSTYPHWFSSTYADYSDDVSTIPVDQHQLLALIAPRPVFLGNARRDVWSDPQGAFSAAEGADSVYELLGAAGLDQNNLADVNFAAELAFYMRGGRHGINAQDWQAFLAFLDAQGGRSAGSPSGAIAAK